MVVTGKTLSLSTTAGQAWSHYRSSLKRAPLLTKSITSFVGFGVGDIIAQVACGGGKKKFDLKRTAHLAIFGGALAGPIAHYWFCALDQRIMAHNPKHPVAIITKATLDQIIMAPLGNCIFYTAMCTMRGVPGQSMAEIEEKLVPTVLSSYKLWPAAHLINFALIPSHMRVLYINIVSIFWAGMLSTISNRKPAQENVKEMATCTI
ncbi:hypothetical protein BSKO_11618 [Bryopsis sp. KO-2023]|nr:hypothetical protein BSKO_11618 [Bryopsis sp. KO-2023]